MKRLILAGNLPFLAVLVAAAAAFFIGRSSVQERDKVAVVEQGALVLEAVLSHPDATPDDLETQVRAPILRVLRKYADQGYTVLDVSRDDSGRMAVNALPSETMDITAEMRQAVHLEPVAARPSIASPASSPAIVKEAHGG